MSLTIYCYDNSSFLLPWFIILSADNGPFGHKCEAVLVKEVRTIKLLSLYPNLSGGLLATDDTG